MESFNEWMDARHLSPEEASEVFAKSPGTIRNWRSIGVPESQREWVLKRMTDYDAAQSSDSLNRIVLDITDAQFDSWNDASTEAGLRLRDWAIAALDDAARDVTGSGESPNPLHSLKKVAEPGTDYLPKKGNGA